MSTLTNLPTKIQDFIGNAKLTDTSGCSGAKTYFIDKGSGYYLKIWQAGKLENDYKALSYFSKDGFAPKPIMLISNSMDYLLTESAKGKPAINTSFLEKPKELAIRLGEILRGFHDGMNKKNCPFSNSVEDMMSRVNYNFTRSHIDEGMLGYVGGNETNQIYNYICENVNVLKNDVVLHGDFCLPNIMMNTDMKLTCFIDLNAAGVGDRHYDIHWGKWSLSYNLKTREYEDLFMDSYGRDAIDAKRLKVISYISCFDE